MKPTAILLRACLVVPLCWAIYDLSAHGGTLFGPPEPPAPYPTPLVTTAPPLPAMQIAAPIPTPAAWQYAEPAVESLPVAPPPAAAEMPEAAPPAETWHPAAPPEYGSGVYGMTGSTAATPPGAPAAPTMYRELPAAPATPRPVYTPAAPARPAAPSHRAKAPSPNVDLRNVSVINTGVDPTDGSVVGWYRPKPGADFVPFRQRPGGDRVPLPTSAPSASRTATPPTISGQNPLADIVDSPTVIVAPRR